MHRWEAKVVGIIITFVLPMFFTILPHFLAGYIERKGKRGERVLCLLMCYGGGIFFGTFLLHMGPEVRHLLDVWLLKPYNIRYPLTDLIIGCGFFFVLYAEKIVMRINKRRLQRRDRRMRENCIMYQRNNQAFVCIGCSAGKKCDGFMDSQVVCVGNSPNICSRISIQVADIEHGARDVAGYSLSGNGGWNGDEISTTDTMDTSVSDDSSNKPAAVGMSTTENERCGDKLGVVANADAAAAADAHQQHQHDAEATHHNVRSLILIMALSLHHIFEGMSLGLQHSVSRVFTLLIALMCHETIISFSLGLQFVKCKYRLKRHIITALCCCIIMPIGVGIGTVMTEVGAESTPLEIANGVLQAFAAGTFIFVTFFEILQEEIDPHDTSIGKIACVMAGFMTMALLQLIPAEPAHNPASNSTDATNFTTITAFDMVTSAW